MIQLLLLLLRHLLLLKFCQNGRTLDTTQTTRVVDFKPDLCHFNAIVKRFNSRTATQTTQAYLINFKPYLSFPWLLTSTYFCNQFISSQTIRLKQVPAFCEHTICLLTTYSVISWFNLS